ncbi:hypothetical protein MMC07_006522 [Pseudocyphellaria aurata]|nr:hypothetical protein [Pseudocyphellaria aurata]
MTSFQCIPSSQHSVPSPDGRYVATVHESRLEIRLSAKAVIIQSFPLPRDGIAKWRFLQWSGRSGAKAEGSNRVLLANGDTIRIWDVGDSQWSAVVNGATSGLGEIARVCFGFSANEILVFSSFGVKVTVWSLATSRGHEIKDPKSLPTCYDYRPRTGHLAILTRESAHDTLMLLAPGTCELLGSVDLTTVDAQGVKWSPDGQWLAIWDAASMGYKVSIFTADGHLFKVFSGGQDTDNIGMGIKTLNWSSSDCSLNIGGFDQRTVILQRNTFYPSIAFEHTSTIDDPRITVWEEQISASEERSYVMASPPTCPPAQSIDASFSNTGVAFIEYNIDGSLLATRDDTTPSTVWIWSPQSPSAVAILIHHSPVKKVWWHPSIVNLLLIQCDLVDPVAHLWNAAWEAPKVIKLPLDKLDGKIEAKWLFDEAIDLHMLMLGNAHNYVIGHISPDGELASLPDEIETTGAGPEDMFDEGNSLDLCKVSDEVDDTFRFRRHAESSI